MKRRGFLAGILAAAAAPAIVRAGVLMPIRPPIWVPTVLFDSRSRVGDIFTLAGSTDHTGAPKLWRVTAIADNAPFTLGGLAA